MGLLDKITGKTNQTVSEEIVISEPVNKEVVTGVDHLWMKEDIDANKPTQVKDPRVDTGILRNRIADKIAKMNNH